MDYPQTQEDDASSLSSAERHHQMLLQSGTQG